MLHSRRLVSIKYKNLDLGRQIEDLFCQSVQFHKDNRSILNEIGGSIINAIQHLRKVTKSRGAFPNDEAVMKLFYLALMNISKRWTMPLRDWKPALNRFSIQFGKRMPQELLTDVYTKFRTRPVMGKLLILIIPTLADRTFNMVI